MGFPSPSEGSMETDRLNALSHLGDDSSTWHRLRRRPGGVRPVRQTTVSYSTTGKAARPLRFSGGQGKPQIRAAYSRAHLGPGRVWRRAHLSWLPDESYR